MAGSFGDEEGCLFSGFGDGGGGTGLVGAGGATSGFSVTGGGIGGLLAIGGGNSGFPAMGGGTGGLLAVGGGT